MNILIVGPSWVGDMVMSHSLIQQLKVLYPFANIDVVAPEWSLPLVARMPEVRVAIINPFLHGDLAIGKRRAFGLQLKNQYDLAITLPNSFKSALVPFFAGIPKRRGWLGEKRYFILNDIHTKKERFVKMVERYVALAFCKNIITHRKELPILPPKLKVDETEIFNTLETIQNELQIINDREFIAFCPGAEFGPAKRWPHYHFAELANKVIAKGYAVYLIGSKNDYPMAQAIKKLVKPELVKYCFNLSGHTTLNQAVDVIAASKAVVTNDSGLMHISAALNKKLIALFGPSSPAYTPPLTDLAVILRNCKKDDLKLRRGNLKYGYHQSLDSITPMLVWQNLQKLL